MTLILSSAQLTHPDADDDHAEVFVHLHARIVAPTRAPTRAHRAVNGWLCLEVGDRMLAGSLMPR